jgi:hypothetical protein
MIDTPTLRALIRTGHTGELVVRGTRGGFFLVVRSGLDEEPLAAQRGGVRKFKRLDAAAAYLSSLGAHRFVVEVEDWSKQKLLNV